MALGEIVGAKALDLLISGLHRGGSVVYGKINRLQKIDQALNGLATTNLDVEKALHDFETVIGTYKGQLTERLHAFLLELQVSGVLDVMVQNALLSRDSSQVKDTFANMYSRFLAGQTEPKDPGDLYEKLMISFRITLRELAKDKIAFDLKQGSHRELASKLDRIDDALSTLLSYQTQTNRPTLDNLTPTLTRISRGLQASYKNIRVETNRGPREVDINRIYIPPQLRVRKIAKGFAEISDLTRDLTVGNKRRSMARSPRGVEDQGKLKYADFAQGFQRVVVLGDPGGGKSTLCQKLCYDMARNTSLLIQYNDEARLREGPQRLPIRVILRKFEQARASESQLSLIQFMVRDIQNYANDDPNNISECLNYLLETGRAVLAFDGLDEILDTSKRQDFVELVTAVSNQYPLCPVLVTSRLIGYEDAPLSDDFEELLLEKLEDEEVELYVKKFMQVIGSKTKKEGGEIAEHFIAQTEDTANDLRRNPLLLGLMAWLYLANGDVPSNRPEIYKECSILLFERWDQKRGIHADATSDFDRSQLFIMLASEIYADPKLAAGVTKPWLTETLQAWFLALYENRAKAHSSAVQFVKFITGRAWVMTEMGKDTFAFTHQTFLEYFFARHIDDDHDSVRNLLRALRPRIVRKEWSEVSQLALQLKTDGSLRRQEEAVPAIGAYIAEARIPKQQLALMGFGARALEYLSPSESTLGSFLETMYRSALERAEAGEFSGLEAFTHCATTPRDRRQYAQEKIEQLLVKSLFEGSKFESSSAAYILSGRSPSNRRWGMEDPRTKLPSALCTKIQTKLKKEVLARRKTVPLHAALALSWYQEVDIDEVREFGVAPFFNYPSNHVWNELNGISGLALFSSGVINFSKDPKLRDRSERMLVTIATGALELLPFDRAEFSRRNFLLFIPDEIWLRVYEKFKKSPDALIASIFARTLESKLARRNSTVRKASINTKKPRKSPTSLVSQERAMLEPLCSEYSQAGILLDVLDGKVSLLQE